MSDLKLILKEKIERVMEQINFDEKSAELFKNIEAVKKTAFPYNLMV